MTMIEVDPKLFVKCRLCLDETGQYQIVPNVQMQIKYCFDIDVEPFDGLPQLVCKKCESILSQYAGIKQIFQEKQKNLKSKLVNSNATFDTIIQQQQDTVSSTQADTENKKLEEKTRLNRITPVPTSLVSTESKTSNRSQRKNKKITLSKHSKKKWQSTYKKCFVCRFCSKSFKDIRGINSHIQKKCRIYTKYSNINKAYCLVRLNKMGEKSNCTGSLDNVVFNKNKIIQSSEATYYVLYTNESPINYQNNSSESSDEDFFVDKKKYKRRRLISGSSNETVVIEQNTAKSSDDEKVAKLRKNKHTQIVSDIECVNIDDSDSNSTKSSVKTKDLVSETVPFEKISPTNDKMVNNIISMCFTKYMNRLNASERGNTTTGKEESSLKHKILSIGRKVICSNGVSTTGLLRYMEHKNLEVVWVSKIDTKVIIKTRSKESGDNDNSNFGWENITSLPNHNYVPKDFALDFERISVLENSIEKQYEDKQLNQVNPQCQVNNTEKAGSTLINFNNLKENQTVGKSLNCDPQIFETPDNASAQASKMEKKVNDNFYLRAVLDADKNWTKLLNANPVANPKQLPKKNTFNEPASLVKIYTNEFQNDSEVAEQANADQGNDMLHMPIITSTVSLAPVDKEQANLDSSNKNANKFNDDNSIVQSTMPKIKVKPVSELMPEKGITQQNNTFVSTTGWTVNNESRNQNAVLQTNNNNMVYIASGSFTNVIPVQQDHLYYSQNQNIEAVGFNPIINQSGSKQHEYVILHTVDLPNTRTDSPYRYFKKLLQIHNIHLLHSEDVMALSMDCLLKFKAVIELETNGPVIMNLVLYCGKNLFCIKVMDANLKVLDISLFSANWQWQILKLFIGEDIVPSLLANALKYGNALYNQAAYFANLLRSIVYSKES